MKSLVYCCLIFVIIFAVGCGITDSDWQVENTDFTAESEFDYAVNIMGKNHLHLESVNGPVHVHAVKGLDLVTVKGVKRVGSETLEDAEHHLKCFDVQVMQDLNAVHVKTLHPKETNGRDYSTSYNVTIPQDWSVDIDLVNGSVDVDSCRNNVSVEVTNGPVTLEAVQANVYVRTTNGQIQSDLVLPENGLADLKTTNGFVSLLLPKTTCASFAAQVDNGVVQFLEFPLTIDNSSSTHVRGYSGNANGRILLRAINGNIFVYGK